MTYVKNSLSKDWIQSETGLNEDAVTWAKNFGMFLAERKGSYSEGRQTRQSNENALSTTQIRRFFGQIKRLQAEGYSADNRDKLLMLGVQLAYAVGRDKKRRGRDMVDSTKIIYFHDELTKAIKYVNDPTHFKNFVNLIEAVVAYHKFKGGE